MAVNCCYTKLFQSETVSKRNRFRAKPFQSGAISKRSRFKTAAQRKQSEYKGNKIMTNTQLAKRFVTRLSAKDHPEAIRGIGHYYELRQQRLEKYGLKVSSSFSEDGVFEGREMFTWEDDHYRETCVAQSGKVDTVIRKDRKVLYKNSEHKLFYTSITDTKAAEGAKKDVYCCPNCGAVSTVENLLARCAYCGTHFEMKDLYPKVSLNYAIKEIGMTDKMVKSQLMRFMIPGAALAEVICVLGLFSQADKNVFSIIFSLIFAAPLGAGLGYVIFAISKLFTVFSEAAKSMTMLPALSSGRKFTRYMSRYSPEFSFEHFRGEVISLLNILIFSEKDTELPFYTGPQNDLFEDVIESNFRGAIKLNNFYVKNDICTVTVTAYLDNIHYNGSKVSRKNEKVTMILEKDLNRKVNFPFGIHAVKCLSCAGSFDAYKGKVCPYCAQPYEARDLGWIVKKFRKN